MIDKDKWQERKPILILLLMLAFFFAAVIWGKVTTVNPIFTEEDYTITSAKGSTSRYEQVEASEDYLYFVHSGKTTNVEVRNFTGEHLYTISFEDINNGLASIRTEKEKVFIQLRCGNVFVFRGEEKELFYSPELAKDAGYTDEWFDNGPENVKYDKENLYISLSNGDTQKISMPSHMVIDEPGGEISPPWNIVFLVIVVAFGGFMIYYFIKLSKNDITDYQ